MNTLAALAAAANSLAPLIFCAVVIALGSVAVAFLLAADDYDPMAAWHDREPGELPEVEK